MRDYLEERQVWIYFSSLAAGALIAKLFSGTERLELAVNPALALMLFVTFLQVPMRELGSAFREVRFMSALLTANFIVVPAAVFFLSQLAPADGLLRLGILMVLLTPCIDYVITFAHLGRADARLLLASTPMLLVIQMLLLPIYLALFLDEEAAAMVRIGPFLHAFLWLIVAPLLLAAASQYWAANRRSGRVIAEYLGVLPVPATALVLFLVAAATVPVLGAAISPALSALPIYIAFAIIAPLLGWATARMFALSPNAARSVAFSAATRNSLVVLPLALAIPGAVPVLPAVIVTQTVTELIAELVYTRVLPLLGGRASKS